MSQSYPWFKFAHIEYLLNPAITSLSLEAQGANTRLMAYAARQPEFGTLPTNEKQLISMSGCKSVKQWHKILNELFSNGIWKTIGFAEDGNVRLFCPMMIVESAPVSQEAASSNEDNDKPLTNAERCRRYRENRKNVGDTNSDTSSDTLNMSSDTTATRTQHDSDTTKSVDSVSFGGIKGGDLDLDLNKDLDLDQEFNSQTKTREAEKKSSRFFDDELRPDVNALNAKLGANLVTEEFITQNLFAFNAHYETQQLTDNQRLAKWINWLKSEEAKKQAQTIQRPNKTQPPKSQKPVFGNVNESFPLNPNDRPLTAAEKAEIARMLEEDENVVF